ncbi:MAG TPA: hypothetical protein VG097_09760 [Gemmata sp.]|jgi:hypothetical protein|nr:hypothetical protein [Gemmata sp.]
MPSRVLLSFALVLQSSLLTIAGDDDPKETIFKAKSAYTAEIAKLRSEVIAAFDKREEKARAAGNKKLVDEIKFYRSAFDEDEEWPAEMPAELRTRLTKARSQVEAAYLIAIKDYTKTKKDEEAAATEKDLAEFRKVAYCPLLDLSKVEVKEGFFRIPPNTLVTTRKPYKGALEIALVARTEAENIRLHAHRGATVIFNWEINPAELRVCRPDGKEELLESGSLATAKVTPLKPNTYYTLRWLLTPQGMAVSENGHIAFSEKKDYDLEGETKIAIGACKSKVDIKEFKVTRLFISK